MQIYIDESGSFVSAGSPGSWNVVAAVVAAESARTTIEKCVKALKLSVSAGIASEVKLKDIPEARYLSFLDELSQAQVLLFSTATDAGYSALDRIARHQKMLVENVRDQIPRMRYEGGRLALRTLADQIEAVSPQLYAQLVCQVDLLHDIVGRSINYFAQRVPGTLSEFRWRIDQKNTSRTIYEDAFEKIAPVLLETRSFREPGVRVRGFDYRRMSTYEFEGGRPPDYLATEHGIHVEDAVDIQKIIRGNLKFEDSKRSLGIQVADLIASGLRRCLRAGFQDNRAAAASLGRLMLQNRVGSNPINLISFAEKDNAVDSAASAAVKEMRNHSRPMIKAA